MAYPHEILAQKPSLHQICMFAEGNLELSPEELEEINISEILGEISSIVSFPPASLILSEMLMAGAVKVYNKKLNLLKDDLDRRIRILEFDAFDDSEEDDGITEISTEPAKDELIKVESSIKESDAQPH